MGHVHPGVAAASDTSIEITFAYRGTRCRERLRLQPTPANLKRAAQHRAAVLDAIAKGTFDYATTFPDSPRRQQFSERAPGELVMVEHYMRKWLDQRKAQLKTSTWTGYRKIIAIVNERFGTLALTELKRPAIKTWLSGLKCSNKRLANIQSVLRAALADAVDDELLEANPLYEWSYRNADEVKDDDDVDPFTIEEESLVLKHLTGQVRNLFQFFFWTGLRTSEAIALRWADVDWQRGEIKINRARTQTAADAETPKTKAGRRIVKLLPPALEALIAQKPHTYMLGQEVFHDPRTNEPWAGDQPVREGFWVPTLRRAKVRYRRPYQTRHTYASRMLTAGESPMWVAAQLGHSDWGMIRRVYGRWIPDAQPEAGMKAVAMFNTKREATK